MKEEFTQGQIAAFLRRSYFALDGLWFVKTEERHGFDDAMTLDEAVWQTMSKIQARKAKEILGITEGSLEELARAFQLKLSAEGHDFDVDIEKDQARITIFVCQWYEALKSSGRTDIAEIIADRICTAELDGWAREFSPDLEIEMSGRLCVAREGCNSCGIAIKRKAF